MVRMVKFECPVCHFGSRGRKQFCSHLSQWSEAILTIESDLYGTIGRDVHAHPSAAISCMGEVCQRRPRQGGPAEQGDGQPRPAGARQVRGVRPVADER
jgi:hypothetical protein